MNLTRWQHALLSLLILIGLIVLVIVAVAKPAIAHYQGLKSELQTQQQHLQRFHDIASQKDKLIPFYKKQISGKIAQQHFLPVMAPSLAAARLQEQVKGMLQGTPGQLISTQPVPAQQEGLFTPVMIRIHMKSDIETLLHVLHRLEDGQPLAFINNLQIQLIGGNRPANNRRKTTNSNVLDTRFDLKVYMLNQKGRT